MKKIVCKKTDMLLGLYRVAIKNDQYKTANNIHETYLSLTGKNINEIKQNQLEVTLK